MPTEPPDPGDRLDFLRTPALVGPAATVPPLAGLLAFPDRLAFEPGLAPWRLAAAATAGFAMLAAARRAHGWRPAGQ